MVKLSKILNMYVPNSIISLTFYFELWLPRSFQHMNELKNSKIRIFLKNEMLKFTKKTYPKK